MAITVTMIEEKEFKTKVRGYDPVEVDEFLDEICDEMIEMQGTIQTLRDQLKQKAAEYTASSFAPLPVAPLTLPQLGLMARLRGSEAAIAEAALTGDRDRAWEGFALHPLVDSPRLGAALLDGYCAAHPGIAALFDR